MSKTKVTIQWAVKFPSGQILKALDKEDAVRMLKESKRAAAQIVTRQKHVHFTEWE